MEEEAELVGGGLAARSAVGGQVGLPGLDVVFGLSPLAVETVSRRLKIDYDTLIHVSAAAMLFASITRLVASVTMR